MTHFLDKCPPLLVVYSSLKYYSGGPAQKRLQQVAGTNVRVIKLFRDEDGFGLRIEKDDRVGVAVVTNILPNTTAQRSGEFKRGEMLRRGWVREPETAFAFKRVTLTMTTHSFPSSPTDDAILFIDNESVQDMPHDEIISKLRSMDRATFVVADVDLVRAVLPTVPF